MTRLIYNAIRTPDGTVLESFGTHDYKTHIDKNGFEYMVDGGIEYTRRNINDEPFEELSVCLEDGHAKVREVCTWGTYGKDGKGPFRRVKLCDMTTEHIQACLDTQRYMHPNYKQAFKDELEHRVNFPNHIA